MAQYIDKDALVAEIKRMLNAFKNSDASVDRLRASTLIGLLSFINTLEVKEVDLKEEIDKIWKPRFSLGWDDKSLLSVSYKGFEIIAKHFFELGLKAQKA